MDSTRAVERQRAYFQTGVTRPLEFRQRQLRALHDAIEVHEPALIAALHSDLRKSPTEAYAAEIGMVLSELRHVLRQLPSWMQRRKRRTPLLAWPSRGEVVPEPYGVALIIGPWNYPFQLLFAPLVGAISAGNCAILKPSEFAPHTAAVVEKLISASFPQEYTAVITGERQTAEALLREKFDTIFFTGSTTVGRAVMAAAAWHLTPVTLELGGKSPCIVCADAPTRTTARRIVWGKFMNAGQTCVAPNHLLVDRRTLPALTDALKRAIIEFYGTDPQESPDYGRIINRKHFDRLAAHLPRSADVPGSADVSPASSQGAQPAPSPGHILHGGQLDAAHLYIAPTLIGGIPANAPIMHEEIFGPILPIIEFDHLDAALDNLRRQPTPLALYLFTSDAATQKHVLAATRSGGVCINDTVTHIIPKDLPFGGLGESGFGSYHGKASFDTFTHYRSVMRRSFTFDPAFRYPPARVTLPALKRAARFLFGG